jgi:sugar lactone lactonase YvrE
MGPTIEVAIAAGAEVGEAPIWDSANSRLIWVDIAGFAVHFYDPQTRQDASTAVEQMPGVAIPRRNGGLVIAIGHGFAFLDDDGRLEWIEQLPQGSVTLRMNDGKCDSAGRFWAGTMGLAAEPKAGSLYRMDADLAITRMRDGITESNGIDWSPDDRLMYHVDSLERRIDVYDFDIATGSIENRRRFLTVGHGEVVPDGLTVDSEGCVWVALWGGSQVRRFAPDGALQSVLELPTRQVTSCAFAGPELRDLYVTSAREGMTPEALAQEPHAGALFVCRPGATGRAPHLFAG